MTIGKPDKITIQLQVELEIALFLIPWLNG